MVSYDWHPIPLWQIQGILALPLIAWLALAIGHRLRQRLRDRLGLCRRCGYDLRASRERCPECGTPIAARAGKVMR
jgi:predicted amidophosphoribosyltransferase